MIWPKVIRDPVHGIIPFEDTDCDRLLLDLINTREFQRLRRIKQLGMSELVFPGANHSRFSHSIGVLHIARKMLDRAIRLKSPRISEEQQFAVLVAALLHDVGHGPFSHLYERVFDDRGHEDWTKAIVRNARGEIGRLLRREGIADEILAVYDRTYRPAFVIDIVSSQLDADRLDYLLRDSYMTGVAYGRYDLEWILNNLRLAHRGPGGTKGTVVRAGRTRGRRGTRGERGGDDLRLAINGTKGYHAAEQFVIGRYLMYQQVYYHKTSRAAEQMIRTALQRLVDSCRETGRFPDPCPGPIRRVVETAGDMSVDEYLRLDDWLFLSAFAEWGNVRGAQIDPVLRDLCDRITRRHLFKTVKVKTETRHKEFGQALEGLSGAFREKGLDPRYYLLEDDATDLPYRDLAYSDRMGTAPEDIGLSIGGRIVGYMSERTISPLIDSIRNEPRKLRRLCFPGRMRGVVERRLRSFISREHP